MISVIYETKDFVAVNKPAGVLVHPVKSLKHKTEGEGETLAEWAVKRYPEVKNVGDEPEVRPGIVHRLDRDTSGIILICRNQEFFEYAKNLFKTHEIKKTYLALVWGKLEPKTGEIKTPIGIKNGSIKRTVWQKTAKDLKDAVTEYKVVKNFEVFGPDEKVQDFSLVEVSPKTGRTHQIRIHMASVGHPVVGDKLYGGKNTAPFELDRQFLHAASLEFAMADGHRIMLEAELPEELKRIIDTFSEKR